MQAGMVLKVAMELRVARGKGQVNTRLKNDRQLLNVLCVGFKGYER